MRKQTIRTIAAVFACGIVSASLVTNAFAAEETTTAVETTTTAVETTTALEETTTVGEETTTTIYTDAPLERVTPGQVTVEDNFMYNEFVKLFVREDGIFYLDTTNGDPLLSSDNNKTMLYHRESDGLITSYSTIVIDGTARKYSADSANKPVFDAEHKKVVSAMTVGKLFITQTISFANNVSTGEENVIEIRYDVKNNDTVSHTVGGRIMLDTMLGTHDDAPFRIPGTGNVTTEKEYVGDAVPDYFQVFDDLSNPSIIAMGSFKRADFNHPDKVQFTNWRNVSDTPWNYQIEPDAENGDSAVSAIWNEKELVSGGTVVYRTYYGLSELTQDLLPPLALSAYADATVNMNGVAENEFATRSVSAYLENIGEGDAENTYLRIQLPEGWEIADTRTEEEKAENPDVDLTKIELGTLKADDPLVSKAWNIKIPANAELGTYPVVIYAGCDGIEEKSVTRYITLTNSDREAPPPVSPVPSTTAPASSSSSTTTTTKASTTAPKTGDAGVSGVAAALLASFGVAAALKRRKKN